MVYRKKSGTWRTEKNMLVAAGAVVFQDFYAIAGVNDVKLYGGVPPVLLDLRFR